MITPETILPVTKLVWRLIGTDRHHGQEDSWWTIVLETAEAAHACRHISIKRHFDL